MEIFFGESVQSCSSKTVQFSLALTPLRHQMPERDDTRAKSNTIGNRVGPLQVRHSRTLAGDLPGHPHITERQRSLSGPGILSPHRHCLRRRTQSRLRRKRRSPCLGLLQEARDRNRAQTVRKEPQQLPEQHRHAGNPETSAF